MEATNKIPKFISDIFDRGGKQLKEKRITKSEVNCVATGELVKLFCRAWNQKMGDSIGWMNRHDGGPHEAGFLKLDCSKMQRTFNWKLRWDVKEAVEKTIDWTEDYLLGNNIRSSMKKVFKGDCKSEKTDAKKKPHYNDTGNKRV